MPPLVRDMIAWLRFYTLLPIPAFPGESAFEAESRTQPAAESAVQAVPLAAAIVGAIGAIVLMLAAAAQLPALVIAVLALGALAAATGAATEAGFAEACRRVGAYVCTDADDTRLLHAGTVALVFALILRVAMLDALIVLGPLKAALALLAAAMMGRAAATGVPLFLGSEPVPAPAQATPAGSAHAQYFALFALVILVIAMLPSFGVGATLAGLLVALVVAALALHAARLVGAADERSFVAGTEFLIETAFLLAVLASTRIP